MKTSLFIVMLFLSAASLGTAFAQSSNKVTQRNTGNMKPEKEYGKPNPKAPLELSQFSFIIGNWQCDARVKGADGKWERYLATWNGRYILDGYVIADEYRMTDLAGGLIVHGMNFRSYNTEKKTWVMKWLSATGSFWMDLGPESLGGVRVDSETVTFKLKDATDSDVLSRVTFSNIAQSRFTWSSERSSDHGKTWSEFMVIEAKRVTR